MDRLDGKVALVTGGTAGIGLAITRTFLAAGAKVTITGRSPQRAARAVDALGAGDDLLFVQTDSATSAGCKVAVDACAERFGGVDVLVNNVGGASSQFALVHELTDEGWDDGIKKNLYSTFWTSREALPYMLERSWGRIVNVSSVLGKLVTMPTISPYVAAKHALAGFTKCVALEYGEHGITCNAICPGAVETESFKRSGIKRAQALGITYDEFVEGFTKGTATKRMTAPDELTAVVLLLATDAGANITGVQWSLDGGLAPF